MEQMEHLSVELVLGLTGLTILVGLAGELVFKRIGIPSCFGTVPTMEPSKSY